MVEPLPAGAEVSWQLRSQQSPQDNAIVFRLPTGASLQMSPEVPGGAEVVEEGKTQLAIPPASAVTADGQLLPVSYSVSGSTLTTHVDLSGTVDFPVLVDPILAGAYGSVNNADGWPNWIPSTNSEGFAFPQYPTSIQAGAGLGWPNGAYGEWTIFAPGAGEPGGSGITRVDLTGVSHQFTNQSYIYALIGLSDGNNPVYSFNGLAGASGASPLYTAEGYSNIAVAFCAQGAGGHDGGQQPLCDETAAGQYFQFADILGPNGRTVYNYVEMSGAAITYLDEVPPSSVSLAGSSGEEWVRYGRSTTLISGADQGLGVQRFELQIPEGNPPFFTQELSCGGSIGFAGCPHSEFSFPITGLSTLNTGVYSLGANVVDAAGNRSWQQSKVYIDHSAPVLSPLTGSLAEAPSGEVGDGSYTLSFSATDGTSGAPQVGMGTLEVVVDGAVKSTTHTSCALPRGVPNSQCFGLEGSWTFNGQEFGAGTHTVTVKAKDWLGNESTRSLTITVSEAAFQQVGPGAVNLGTGDFRLSSTDVSQSGNGATLAVSRVYDSRYPTRGEGEALGRGWTLSLPDQGVAEWQSLTPLPSGSVSLKNASGAQLVFSSNGSGGYVSPVGYEADTLTGPTGSPATYKLVDAAGNATTFEQPANETIFVPKTVVQATGAGGLDQVKYMFKKLSTGATEPTEMLAPEPAGVSGCASTFVKGCRALVFVYYESSGCLNQLKQIDMKAWDPSKGEITSPAVAEYSYDGNCRLLAEWDPRISPALKTNYGYDSEGHVVALTPSGEETWAFTYGLQGSDRNPGRLFGVTRASASAGLWNGQPPANTVRAVISGTPIVGVKMSINNGTWSNEPVTYRYQWIDCKTSGGECCKEGVSECTPITGATNPTYTPTASDVGHPLAVRVYAINGGGMVESLSTSSTAVQSTGTPHEGEAPPATASRWTVEYGVPLSGSGLQSLTKSEVEKWGQKDYPLEGTAVFPPDETVNWPAPDYRRASVYYLDKLDHTVNVEQPGGAVSTAEYDSHYNVKRTLTPANRQVAIEAGAGSVAKSELLETKSEYSPDGSELVSTLGPQHTVKLAVGKVKANEEVLARKRVHFYYDEGSPGGETNHLVTKSIEGAETASHEEFDKRTTTTAYAGQENLGWKLHAPTSVTTDPSGLKLTTATLYSSSTGEVTETRGPASSATSPTPVFAFQVGVEGGGNAQFRGPKGLAIDSHGNLWVADDGNHRVQELSSTGSYLGEFGSWGTGEGQFKEPKGLAIDSHGNIWVVDSLLDRVEEFTGAGVFVRQFGKEGIAANEFKEPKAIAVDSHNNVYVTDTKNNRVEKFNESGVFQSTFGFGVSNGEAKLETCTTSCRAGTAGEGNGQMEEPRGIAVDSTGHIYVSDTDNSRIEEFNENETYTTKFGSEGTGSEQFNWPQHLTLDSHNNLWITDTKNNRVLELNEAHHYVTKLGSRGTGGSGQFEEPRGIVVNSHGDIWVSDTNNNRLEEWDPVNPAVHNTQTIYYTTAANSEYPECGNHAEWATLPCQEQTAAQPETGRLPGLPTTRYTYNVWGEPLTTTDTNGTNNRTTTVTYDPGGRVKTTGIAATSGTALPTITDKYNEAQGGLEEQSWILGGTTVKITSTTNKLGQMTSYTDADGNTSTYEYDEDGRAKKLNTGKGTDAYTYSTTTGLPTELVNEYGATKLTFTATYNLDNEIVNEGYPNNMVAKHSYDPTDTPVGLEYIKNAHCGETCTWFSDSVVPSIRQQWITQAGSLSKQTYAYDTAGRLTETQDTPTGKDCTARLYGYDEDTNRTTLTTRESATAECTTTGGTAEIHAYDPADRLTDNGVSYDPWGNLLKIPGSDAGGGEITSGYYANNRLATQTQSEETIGYNLDPALRTRETVATGKSTADTINHYAGPGSLPVWTTETPSGHYTRLIPGLSGLAATQNNTEAPVLQLANLHGDIIATAAASETETKLLSITDTTEYGVPRVSTPAKYSWLGAGELPTELFSGVIAMGARSYIPQLGRFLQADPTPGGSANAYAYTAGDPVNSSDPSGNYTSTITYGTLSDVSTGPGIQTPEGHDTVPGAIIPPPVNMQIEEAFFANPPWAAPIALTTSAEGQYDEEIELGASGGSKGFGVILYKGGPGATCGSNSPSHRKCPNHWKGGEGGPTVGEIVETGKEVFGVLKCAYELYKYKGGGCGNP